MRISSHKYVLALVAFLGLVFVSQRAAHADAKATKKEIEQKIKEAMENYDLLEYEEARKLLNQALQSAKKAKLDSDPVTAKVHLALGIVYYAGLQDVDSAKLSFLSAVEIDGKIQIEAAYKTPDMQKLLDEARSEVGGTGGGMDPPGGGGDDPPSGGGGADCEEVAGVQHEIIYDAKAGEDLKIDALVGLDVGPAKVAVMYRPQGATEFVEGKLTKSGDCEYHGKIPASGLAGELVHYYVAAFNGSGKVIAGAGSSASPNMIELSGGSATATFTDNENPFDNNPKGGGGGSTGGEVGGGVKVGPQKPSKVYFNVALGTGVGFVTGETEQKLNQVECCFAPALLHIFPELGFYIGPKTAVGAALRLGFPVGANLPGHSTAAPAVLLRVRQSLGDGQDGLQVSGAIGGGILRNTIKLTMAEAGMDTDIVAMGPLLIGAGAGYAKSLGGPLKFVAEVNAIAGIPVIGEIGGDPMDGGFKLNFGVEVDANLGLMFGF